MHLKPANNTICCTKHTSCSSPSVCFISWQYVVTEFITRFNLCSLHLSESELLTRNICLACCRLHHNIGQQASLCRTWHSSILLVFVYERCQDWSTGLIWSEHSDPYNYNSIFDITVTFAGSTVPDQFNTRRIRSTVTVNEMNACWAGF